MFKIHIMNTKPKISVIVPAYKTAEYIPACLDSVLAQTFTDFEVICVNDGSPDNALDIFKKYEQRDRRIRVMSQQNMGLVYARNNAISHARGEYIFPLDSDDMIAPNCLQILYDIITKTDNDIVCPGGILFGKTNKIWSLPKINRINMYTHRNGIHNSSLYPRDLWEKYGGYCTELNSLQLEDYDFFLNFIDDNKKATRTQIPLFFYRIKPADISRNCGYGNVKAAEIETILVRRHPKMLRYKKLYNLLHPIKQIKHAFRKRIKARRKKLHRN